MSQIGPRPVGRVAEVVRWACHLELEALKPGNVHVYAAGHGMTVEQFRRSAEVAACPLAREGAGVGQRVLEAARRTFAAVGCNTNLGILLLAAPLAAAAERPEPRSLASRTARVLEECDAADAEGLYEAIRLARPGGLGRSERQDVAQAPTVGLLEAMRIAERRDRIAWQYTHAFEDVFGLGAARIAAARALGWSWPWAAVACHLRLLARLPDSHVARKHGAEVAERVRAQAAELESEFEACENPALAAPALLRFDNVLKRAGINPGTHADLTVASLIAARLEGPAVGGTQGGA